MSVRTPDRRIEAAVASALRLCRLQTFLEVWAKWLFALMSAAGAAALAARLMGAPSEALHAFIGTAAAISLIPPALALRKLPLDRRDVAAWLDKEAGAGGLVMLACERESLSGWEAMAAAASLPKLKARRLRCGLAVLAGLGFAILCLQIPIPERADIVKQRPLDVKTHTEDLRAKVETLQETGAIDQQAAERFEKLLKELEQNRDAYDPGRIFETLDSVDSALKNLGDAAAKSMMDAEKAMESVEMGAESLEVSPDANMERNLRQMAESLSKMLGDAQFSGFQAKGGLNPQDAISSFLSEPPPSDPEKLKRLAEALKSCQQCMKEGMKKLCQSGTCPAQAEALKKFLEQNIESRATSGASSEMWLSKEQADAMKGGYGVGGVTRGRGDAPMIFSPSDAEKAPGGMRDRLKAESLSMDPGESIGVSFAAPEAKAVDDGGQGAFKSGTGSGGQSRVQRISPKDRQAVKKFFSKEKAD